VTLSPDAATPPAIEAAGVAFGYVPGAPPVLRDVSIGVRTGEFLGILGPNGVGKSTLLRLMAGLVAPTAGTVRLAGRDAAALGRPAAARVVAVVPQREPMIFGFTAREVVAMGRAPHTGLFGTLGAGDREVIDAALARCDAVHLAHRPLAELSGGEQKRVLIARALAQRTPVVLLDEPVAFLDIKHQLAVCELLARGVAGGEFTAVAVLHDLNLAAQFCDRLLLLADGTVAALGAVDEVMTYQRVRGVFDAEVYVGQNELNGTRFFVPMRAPRA
jgi:iron complex transport system ATP-binding protein